VLVLTMNIDQHFSQNLEARQRDWRPIDIAFRAPVVVYHPSDNTDTAVNFYVMLQQPLLGCAYMRDIEFRTDVRLFGTASNNGLIGAVSKG